MTNVSTPEPEREGEKKPDVVQVNIRVTHHGDATLAKLSDILKVSRGQVVELAIGHLLRSLENKELLTVQELVLAISELKLDVKELDDDVNLLFMQAAQVIDSDLNALPELTEPRIDA